MSIDRPVSGRAEVGVVVRAELADELGVQPDDLAQVDPEVGAVLLAELGELTRRLGQEPAADTAEEALRDRHEAGRRDLLTRALRDQLAAELGVEPGRLAQLSASVTAHSLLLVRERKHQVNQRLDGEGEEQEQAFRPDRRDVLGRVVREALAQQLRLEPSLLRGLSLDQAAAILVRLSELRTQLHELERRLQPAVELNDRHERRDVVARALRTVLADELHVHPRLLGGLSPVGGARFLSHITAARKTLSRLQAQMAVDELTGALRRAAGEGRLEQEIRRANRLAGGQLTIAFVDVDSLKTVNDSSGHAAGDRLLQTLVTAVRARLRSYDTVVRWGGDEFICILPQTDAQAADKVFGDILDGFKERTGQKFSIGIAGLQEGDSMEDLVARADRHLYLRKRQVEEPAPKPAPPKPPKPGLGTRIARLLRG